MTRDQLLQWYEDLTKRYAALPLFDVPVGVAAVGGAVRPVATTRRHSPEDSLGWITEAESALVAVFTGRPPIMQAWWRILHRSENEDLPRYMPEFMAIFQSGLTMLKDGRLGTLIETVRAETEDELLDQSLLLLNAQHIAAATVLAGGALETHLRHLVAKHKLSITGAGSIGKYDSAISQARNDKLNPVNAYPQAYSKLITAWGGMRNDAAHNPGAFNQTADEVRRMIEGIREFISRTT